MKISKRTRQKFADFCSGYSTLRPIREAFEAEDFIENREYDGPEGGQRRFLVGSFHDNIDFADSEEQHRLLLVYLDAIDSWGRNESSSELVPDAVAVVRSLKRDGAPIDDDGNLLAVPSSAMLALDRFDRLSEPLVLQKHLDRIASTLRDDPAAAIASSKELAESAFKFVLDDYAVGHQRTESMLDLYRKTASVLKIDREAVPDSAKGSRAAQRVLQNLATAVQSLAELRNELGLGHGKTLPSPALERHARLAFNASRTVVEFVLQTWHERKRAEKPTEPSHPPPASILRCITTPPYREKAQGIPGSWLLIGRLIRGERPGHTTEGPGRSTAKAGRSKVSPVLQPEVASKQTTLRTPRARGVVKARLQCHVQELADQLGLVHRNVSHGLNLLYREGLLSRRREGTLVIYSLSDYSACRLVTQATESITAQIEELTDLIAT